MLSAVKSEFKQLFDQLEGLQLACENWMRNFEAPSKNSLDDAFSWLSRLQANMLKPHSVTASADGGVGISFRSGIRYCDIECPNVGPWSVLYSDGKGSVECELLGCSFEHQNKVILNVRRFLEAK